MVVFPKNEKKMSFFFLNHFLHKLSYLIYNQTLSREKTENINENSNPKMLNIIRLKQ